MPKVVTASGSPTYSTTHTVPVNGDAYVANDVESLAQRLLDNDASVKTQADKLNQVKYNISFCLYGNPLPGTLALFVSDVAWSLGTSGPGVAKSSVAATASTVLALTKNGVQIGTVTFGAGSATGTVAVSTAQTFVAGDTLGINGPTVADNTLSTVAVTVSGTQTYA